MRTTDPDCVDSRNVEAINQGFNPVLNKNEMPELARGLTTRFAMIGGFLGAGKTTALEQLGRHAQQRGLRVGLITNDHGKELVDTTILRTRGFATEQVPDGCFSVRFDSLTTAAERLRQSTADILIAEPAGSCTGLAPGVSQPMRQMFGAQFTFAPLSVMVDPVRAARIFGLESGGRFTEKVAYIYKKQLEEAGLLVINKSDLLPSGRLARLKSVLSEHAREAALLTVSARTGEGVAEWFERILQSEVSPRGAVALDYNIYAEGEALLGWFDCIVRLSSVRYFEAAKVLVDLATCIQALLQQEGAEIAHLKIVFKPCDDLGEIAVVNLVRNDGIPEIGQTISEPVQSGALTLNLRAESDPEVLHSAVTRALLALIEKSPDLFARMEHSEHFRPAPPEPAYPVSPLELPA